MSQYSGLTLALCPLLALCCSSCDAFEISDSVSVVVESSLPLIAADNHMIERPVKLDSGFARHGANLARGITLSQYSGLTLVVPSRLLC